MATALKNNKRDLFHCDTEFHHLCMALWQVCISRRALMKCWLYVIFYLCLQEIKIKKQTNCKQYFHLRGVDYLKKKFVQNCIQTEWKWIWLFFIVFQECKNSGGALSSGWISYSVSHMGSCVCLGSTCSEIEMKNEQRQQATCYHFKYFLSTYPEFNFNK